MRRCFLLEMYHNSFIELKLNNTASTSVREMICLIYTQWECKRFTLQVKEIEHFNLQIQERIKKICMNRVTAIKKRNKH